MPRPPPGTGRRPMGPDASTTDSTRIGVSHRRWPEPRISGEPPGPARGIPLPPAPNREPGTSLSESGRKGSATPDALVSPADVRRIDFAVDRARPHGISAANAPRPLYPTVDGSVSRIARAGGADVAGLRGALAVVILPTLNEVEGLARTLSDLAMYRFDEPGHSIRILVVDGGSTDGTLDVARQSDVPVLPQTSRGKGGAMLEAIAKVHRLGIPYVVALDADATYPPDRILPALDLLEGGADLVIGVRHPVWGAPHNLKDLVHRVGNVGLSFTASFLAQRPILDLCSGFWGVSTERFMQLGLNDSSFAIEAELVLKSIRHGHRVHQIPVDYRERVGTAKLRTLRDGSRILRTILQHARTTHLGPTVKRHPVTTSPGGDGPSFVRPPGTHDGPLHLVPLGGPKADRIVPHPRPIPRSVEAAGEATDSVGRFVEWVDDGISPSNAGRTPLNAPPPIDYRTPLHLAANRYALAVPNWSRSGGWMASPIADRARFPSLLVLTSRLNVGPDRQLQALLAANGLMMVLEPPRSPLG